MPPESPRVKSKPRAEGERPSENARTISYIENAAFLAIPDRIYESRKTRNDLIARIKNKGGTKKLFWYSFKVLSSPNLFLVLHILNENIKYNNLSINKGHNQPKN